MSRAVPLYIATHKDLSDGLPPQNMSGTIWTEPIDTTTNSETPSSQEHSTNGFAIWNLLNSQAQSVATSFYKATQWLSQATIVPISLIRSFPTTSDLQQEEDFWIEMPQRPVRDVVMHVEYMGWGKPLDFDFDAALAED